MKWLPCIILTCFTQGIFAQFNTGVHYSLNKPASHTKDSLALAATKDVIDLSQEKPKTILNGEVTQFKDEMALWKFLHDKKDYFLTHKIKVISAYSRGGSFDSQVISLIDKWKGKGCLLGYRDEQNPNIILPIWPVTEETLSLELADSSELLVLVLKDSIRVSFMKKITVYKTVEELDQFFEDNKEKIVRDKMIFFISKAVNPEQTKKLTQIVFQRKYKFVVGMMN